MVFVVSALLSRFVVLVILALLFVFWGVRNFALLSRFRRVRNASSAVPCFWVFALTKAAVTCPIIASFRFYGGVPPPYDLSVYCGVASFIENPCAKRSVPPLLLSMFWGPLVLTFRAGSTGMIRSSQFDRSRNNT